MWAIGDVKVLNEVLRDTWPRSIAFVSTLLCVCVCTFDLWPASDLQAASFETPTCQQHHWLAVSVRPCPTSPATQPHTQRNCDKHTLNQPCSSCEGSTVAHSPPTATDHMYSLVRERELQPCTERHCRTVLSSNERCIQRMELQRNLAGHSGCVNTVSFDTESGSTLISGSDDLDIKLWDWETGVYSQQARGWRVSGRLSVPAWCISVAH